MMSKKEWIIFVKERKKPLALRLIDAAISRLAQELLKFGFAYSI